MLCPRCQKSNLEFVGLEGMRCPACGFDPFRDEAPPGDDDQAADVIASINVSPTAPSGDVPDTPPGAPPIEIDLPNVLLTGEMVGLSEREQLRFESRCQQAQFELGRNNLAAARAALRSALEVSELSDHVWLFLAGLAETRAEQHDALQHALACNPRNQIAAEALARLTGRLDVAVGGEAVESGEVATQTVACPNCGGQLRYDIGAREVVCYHCGHHVLDVRDLVRSGEQTALQIGLLRRKRQRQTWKIGGRWVRCENCGAKITLSRRTLSNTCQFCGSQRVLQEGVNLRFEQPDFIIPFAVDEASARAAIEQKLKSGIRMITRFFADEIVNTDLHGVYLPFWVFDAEMAVNWSWSNAPDHGVHPILLGDVLHFAGETLSSKLLRRLEPYDLMSGRDYEPRLLGVFPAELYAVDVDRASLDVRSWLVRLAKRQARPSLEAHRPSGSYGDDSGPGRLMMNASTRYMSYRLGLFPVWVARLVEEDADTRPALVNGQTGEAVLGSLEKYEDD